MGSLEFHTASQDIYGAPENRVGARLGLHGTTRYAMQVSINSSSNNAVNFVACYLLLHLLLVITVLVRTTCSITVFEYYTTSTGTITVL